MNAEIITIGDELLIGQTVDTNSAWLAGELYSIGIGISRITTISDTREAILGALSEAQGRSSVVILTGGLGPTSDDITKPTLCDYFETSLVMNFEVLEKIESFFDKIEKPMLEVNRKQAELPKDAIILKNVQGSAQGMWFEKQGQVFISMPGVPYEMMGIMRDGGLAMLEDHLAPETIVHRTVLTQGIGESYLAEFVSDWEKRIQETSGLSLAYLPSPGMVRVRVTGRGGERQAMQLQVDQYVEEFKSLLPQHVFGEDEEKLEEVIGQLLMDQGKSLSTAESCTGGYIAHLITSVPGSSAYFLGSVVSYHDKIKSGVLGVSEEDLANYGAVSSAVVEAMAQGCITLTGSDYSIATSGVAGPGGGSDAKPVGTVYIAIAGKGFVKSKRFSFGTSRERNIRKSALTALNWLRREIIAGDFD